VFKKVEDMWNRFVFYDCPGPAVLARDFAARLAASVTRSAVKRKEASRKAKELSAVKGKGKAVEINGVNKIVPIGGLEDVIVARPGL
jgi:hypothetical protein